MIMPARVSQTSQNPLHNLCIVLTGTEFLQKEWMFDQTQQEIKSIHLYYTPLRLLTKQTLAMSIFHAKKVTCHSQIRATLSLT